MSIIGYIPLATGYGVYIGTPENGRWRKGRAVECRGRRRLATLVNTWEHVYQGTQNVPRRVELPRGLERSTPQCVGTCYVSEYKTRVHVYLENVTLATTWEQIMGWGCMGFFGEGVA